MNPFTLLFDFRGRINRGKFWLAILIYVVFVFGVMGIALAVTSSLAVMFAAAIATYVPLVISSLAVGVKRLHDRDKSGMWLLLYYFGPAALNGLAYYAFGGEEGGLTAQVLLFASFGINIWMLIEFGCLRGTIGANQYGSDPLAPQPAAPRTLR